MFNFSFFFQLEFTNLVAQLRYGSREKPKVSLKFWTLDLKNPGGYEYHVSKIYN